MAQSLTQILLCGQGEMGIYMRGLAFKWSYPTLFIEVRTYLKPCQPHLLYTCSVMLL